VYFTRNLLVEGKISRKEFDKIQQADTNYQKVTKKKAAVSAGSAWMAPATNSHQHRLTINVLGKQRIVPVNVSAMNCPSRLHCADE
jgi:Ni,Fe-hydrogenase III small subunit